ncbi:hypothetical protein [Myroides marinus]|uniref:hypothetical protein n=1 Tax=Myroides TaxID=76831 RepID=UPI002574CFF3|nr:hypothetical protein [Myroides marinus]MDM1378183.1 hypothetical protein [Myroides marinus]MDM1385431.1 hypothetical protein [Myroides marinus]MDM1392644.1 hypothetical protein [Myroides marinus]MDM1502279.1 hypothetical protein [Myroides marinus]
MDDTFIYFVALVAVISCLYILVKLIAAVKAHRITQEKYSTLVKEHIALLKLLDKE